MESTNHPVLPLTIDELLTTTRAVRRRLDLDRPVERSVVEECLRLAFQAPTGSDSQGWSWVFVDDPDVRAKMAQLYRAGFDTHARRDQTGEWSGGDELAGTGREGRLGRQADEHPGTLLGPADQGRT